MNKTLKYESSKGLITMSKPVDKELVFCMCAGCGLEGMAYEDKDNPKQEPHYCIDCKKRLHK